MKLPGTRLLTLTRLIVDPAAVARVLEPLVADWQREYIFASSRRHRFAIRTRGVAAFVISAVRCLRTSDVSAALRYQAWLTLLLFVFVGTFISVLPYILQTERRLDALGWLLPSSLVISIPFAILPLAILLGTSGNRSFLVRTTIAVALLVFVLHNWITPYANQAFREHILLREAERAGKLAMYRPPRRGLHELTLPEVFREAFYSSTTVASQPKLREELLRRSSLPLVPVLLAMMGWGLARVSRSAKPMRLLGWWVFACITYGFAISQGMTLERSWSTPREVATLLPLALWSGAIIVLMRSTPNAVGVGDLSAEAQRAEAEALPRHR